MVEKLRRMTLLWLLVLGVQPACAAEAATTGSQAIDVARIDLLTPPGERFDVAGQRIHLLCRGAGRTVVLESGLGGFSLEWLPVLEALASGFRVCAYDRGGYGWSDPGRMPRTTDVLVDELEGLLAAAKLPPPYLLVGHSFGGYIVQAYARRHPDLTRGLLLVDASHPNQFERLPRPDRRVRDGSGGRAVLLSEPLLPESFPPELVAVSYHVMSRRQAIRAQRFEFRDFELSAAQVLAAGPLPPLPLIVLTRGDRVWPTTPEGERNEQVWRELQSELALSSPRGQQVIVPHAGHYIHLDQPAVVAQAVRALERSAACRTPTLPASGDRRYGAAVPDC